MDSHESAALPVSAPAPAVVAAVGTHPDDPVDTEVGILPIGAIFRVPHGRVGVLVPAWETNMVMPNTVNVLWLTDGVTKQHLGAEVLVRPLRLAVSDAPEGSGDERTEAQILHDLAVEKRSEANAQAALDKAGVPKQDAESVFFGDLSVSARIAALAADRDAQRASSEKWWNVLCDTAEALGKVAPEAAPHVAGWAKALREDRDTQRAGRERAEASVAELEALFVKEFDAARAAEARADDLDRDLRNERANSKSGGACLVAEVEAQRKRADAAEAALKAMRETFKSSSTDEERRLTADLATARAERDEAVKALAAEEQGREADAKAAQAQREQDLAVSAKLRGERDKARKIVEETARALGLAQYDARSVVSRAASILAHRDELHADAIKARSDLASAVKAREAMAGDPRRSLRWGVIATDAVSGEQFLAVACRWENDASDAAIKSWNKGIVRDLDALAPPLPAPPTPGVASGGLEERVGALEVLVAALKGARS